MLQGSLKIEVWLISSHTSVMLMGHQVWRGAGYRGCPFPAVLAQLTAADRVTEMQRADDVEDLTGFLMLCLDVE